MNNDYRSAMSPLLEQYAEFRSARDDWGIGSVERLSRFDDFCYIHFPNENVPTQELVDAWCAPRDTEKPSSCNGRVSTSRLFFRWLAARQMVGNLNIPLPLKQEGRTSTPYILTDRELKSFFAECDNAVYHGTPLAQALKRIEVPVLFRLLYSSGIRPIEARLLRRDKVNLENGIVAIVESKGEDQRYVPLHESTADLLRRYDVAADKLLPCRKWFFPSSADEPYNRYWLEQQYSRIAAKCKIPGGSPYSFRHGYATSNINKWIGQGLSFDDRLVYLSKSMGHRKLESTLYYYTLVPAMADILAERCADGELSLYPEVFYEED